MANTYLKGFLVVCTGTFKNAGGTSTDPASVLFQYIDPIGIIHGPFATVKAGTGIYTYGVDTTTPDYKQVLETWYYRFYSPAGDPLQASNADYFLVSNPGGF